MKCYFALLQWETVAHCRDPCRGTDSEDVKIATLEQQFIDLPRSVYDDSSFLAEQWEV
jgi:hypothetical protein